MRTRPLLPIANHALPVLRDGTHRIPGIDVADGNAAQFRYVMVNILASNNRRVPQNEGDGQC